MRTLETTAPAHRNEEAEKEATAPNGMLGFGKWCFAWAKPLFFEAFVFDGGREGYDSALSQPPRPRTKKEGLKMGGFAE